MTTTRPVTPAEWLAALRRGDGAGLIPPDAARALVAAGSIAPITDPALDRAERQGRSIMARVTPRTMTRAKPEATREQENAADAFALEHGRCVCFMEANGLMRCVALTDDVEIGSTLTFYDEDGAVVLRG